MESGLKMGRNDVPVRENLEASCSVSLHCSNIEEKQQDRAYVPTVKIPSQHLTGVNEEYHSWNGVVSIEPTTSQKRIQCSTKTKTKICLKKIIFSNFRENCYI